MKVRVHDSTRESIFVIFQRDACALFNKTAAEMFEEEDKVYLFIFFPLFLKIFCISFLCCRVSAKMFKSVLFILFYIYFILLR